VDRAQLTSAAVALFPVVDRRDARIPSSTATSQPTSSV
jgi:hypothetical protein